MSQSPNEQSGVEHLLDTPDLAEALGSERFTQILDQVPVALAVSELAPADRIIFANVEFQRLTGCAPADLVGADWAFLTDVTSADGDPRPLAVAITENRDHIGAFTLEQDGASVRVDAWSNLIEDEEGLPVFRLVALVRRLSELDAAGGDIARLIEEKDLLLRELQHRVKNNLQMITALIRIEARGLQDGEVGERFDRLAGRIEALALLYRLLTESAPVETVDLGVYLSEIASAVMRAHAVEGIHLDLQVDTWPVSVNVAMPTGLMVNELLTNALKHAFEGRNGGSIQLHSLVEKGACRVVVADDGVGLPAGAVWPKPGKMSALIARSLLQNAKATFNVSSSPGRGTRVTIDFAQADATPASD
jgi:two-component sensor histidine kinase